MYSLNFLLLSIFVQTLILQAPTAWSQSPLSMRNPSSIIKQAVVENEKRIESRSSLSEASLWSENNVFSAANEMTRLGATNISKCYSSLIKLEMDLRLAKGYALRSEYYISYSKISTRTPYRKKLVVYDVFFC